MANKELEIVSGRPVEFEDKKITTCEFRLSYPHLFKAKAYKDGKPKFSLVGLIPKDTDISQLRIAAENAAIEKWGAEKSQWPSKKVKLKSGKVVSKPTVVMPFKDGDIENPDKPEYEGMYFFSASTNETDKKGNIKVIPVLDQSKEPLQSGQLKAGDYVRASVVAFAYPEDGKGPKVGVSFALLAVQKIRTGEALGSGGGNAANDFDVVDAEEMDDDSEDEY